jgi:hypothetical protein
MPSRPVFVPQVGPTTVAATFALGVDFHRAQMYNFNAV